MIMIKIGNITIIDKFKHSVCKREQDLLKLKIGSLFSAGIAVALLYVGCVEMLLYLFPQSTLLHLFAKAFAVVFCILFLSDFFFCIFRFKRMQKERNFVHFLRTHSIQDVRFYRARGRLYFELQVIDQNRIILYPISICQSLSLSFSNNNIGKLSPEKWKEQTITIFIKN